MNGRTPRIAWFSPLHGVSGEQGSAIARESVGAYCTEILLPLLTPHFEIELYCDHVTGNARYHDLPTWHYVTAMDRHARAPYDLFFYQLEDSRAADFVRFHLALQPGVVWFHDLLFSTHGPVPILNSAWEESVAHFRDERRSWRPHDYEYPERGPLGLREAALAGVALFSSHRAHGEYLRHRAPGLSEDDARSYYLPLPTPVPPQARTPIPGGELKVGMCATPRLEHRAHKALQAIAAAQRTHPVSLLWLIAEGERGKAEELVREFGVSGVALVTGRTPKRWSELSAEIEVALHPLFSAFGQPGPYLGISLRAGNVAVATRFGEMEGIGEGVAFQIEAGSHEAEAMRAVLCSLAEATPEARRALARVGKNYADEMYDGEVIAQELRYLLGATANRMRDITAEWESLLQRARAVLRDEARACAVRGDPMVEQAWRTWCEPAWREFGWTR